MFIICNTSLNVMPAAARGAQEDVGRGKGKKEGEVRNWVGEKNKDGGSPNELELLWFLLA